MERKVKVEVDGEEIASVVGLSGEKINQGWLTRLTWHPACQVQVPVLIMIDETHQSSTHKPRPMGLREASLASCHVINHRAIVDVEHLVSDPVVSLVLAYLEVNDEHLPHRLKNVYETAGPVR